MQSKMMKASEKAEETCLRELVERVEGDEADARHVFDAYVSANPQVWEPHLSNGSLITDERLVRLSKSRARGRWPKKRLTKSIKEKN
jgi:hypothetical protein